MQEIPFHSTGYGRRFFDVQLPQLLRAIERLGDNVAELTLEVKRQNRITNGEHPEGEIVEND